MRGRSGHAETKVRPGTESAELTAIRLLNTLARAAPADADSAINQALADLGRVSGFDRTYLFRLRDGAFWDNTHEWCASGIEPMIDHLQGLPRDLVAPWEDNFQRDEAVYIPLTSDLPDERAEERGILQAQGIVSLLVVPVLDQGAPVGFVGCDAVHGPRRLDADDIMLLQSVANGIGALTLRLRAELALKENRDRLEATLDALPDLILDVDTEGRVRHVHLPANLPPLIPR